MPPPPKSCQWPGPLMPFQPKLTGKVFVRPGPMTLQLSNVFSIKNGNSIWDQSRLKELLGWGQPRQRQHFGPKARISDLFDRRDQIYFALETQRLQWFVPPPTNHHDLLHAAAKVGHIEERIGYIFKDKMICIEALKITSIPLYYKGVVHKADKNNRLALLGDRVLCLALCELWFWTGNSTSDYSQMSLSTETRAALCTSGKKLGIHRNLLLPPGVSDPSNDHVAEAFEAILGAVYVDSGHSVATVKEVITSTKLDTHRFLKADSKSRDAQEERDIALRAREERERTKEPMAARVRVRRGAVRRQPAKEEPLVHGAQNRVSANSGLSFWKFWNSDGGPPVEAAPKASAVSQIDRNEDALVSAEPDSQVNKAKKVGNTTPGPASVQQQADVVSTDTTTQQSLEQKKQETQDIRIKKLKNDVWISATVKANKLAQQGRPADVQALYETMVENMLENERRRASLLVEATAKAETQMAAAKVEAQKATVKAEAQKVATKAEAQKVAAKAEAQKAAAKAEEQKVAAKAEAQKAAAKAEEQKVAAKAEAQKAAAKAEAQKVAAKVEAQEKLARTKAEEKIARAEAQDTIAMPEVSEKIGRKLKDAAWLSAKTKATKLARKGQPSNIQALYEKIAEIALGEEKRRLARAERKATIKARALAVVRSKLSTEKTLPIKTKIPSAPMPQLKEATPEVGDCKETRAESLLTSRAEAPASPSDRVTTPEYLAEGQDQALRLSGHGSSIPAIVSSEAQEAAAPPPVQAVSRPPRAQEPATTNTQALRQRDKQTQAVSRSIDQIEKDIVDSHNDAWQEAGAVAPPFPHSIRTQAREAEWKAKFGSKRKLKMELDANETNAKPVAGPEIYESEVEKMMMEISRDDYNKQDRATRASGASDVKFVTFDFSFDKPLQSTAHTEAEQEDNVGEQRQTHGLEKDQPLPRVRYTQKGGLVDMQRVAFTQTEPVSTSESEMERTSQPYQEPMPQPETELAVQPDQGRPVAHPETEPTSQPAASSLEVSTGVLQIAMVEKALHEGQPENRS